MRVSSFTSALLLFILLNEVALITYTGFTFTPYTAKWYIISTTMLLAGIVLVKWGHVIIPQIMARLGVKIYLGDGYIEDKYFIVKNYDTSEIAEVRGFSIVKLIPRTPSVDLTDEEKKNLIGTVERSIRSIPDDVVYCVGKFKSREIERVIKKIEREIDVLRARIAASAKNPGKQRELEDRKRELEKELERIRKSNPVIGIIYIHVIASGRSVEEVKRELDKKIKLIESLAIELGATTRVLRGPEIQELLETTLIGRVLRIE